LKRFGESAAVRRHGSLKSLLFARSGRSKGSFERFRGSGFPRGRHIVGELGVDKVFVFKFNIMKRKSMFYPSLLSFNHPWLVGRVRFSSYKRLE
ncbi:hypothetical protein, partial [Halalkalicoccus jeotgali]|uniref:hypothetical protein n=1 Tax=Halalkalicoccus jeotgali TaxID=413810 RepID=UPI0019D3B57B